MEKLVVYCLVLILLVQAFYVQALTNSSNTTVYSCDGGPSLCHTLVVYRAQAPHYLTMDSISDMFGVSKSRIARASNLVNEDTQLVHGQSLLVPITCGCMGNVSQANVTYQIRGDDETFYLVSTNKLQNLTTHQAAEAANPEVNPYKLLVGTEVVMPIRCKCPTKAQLEKGINMLITYVFHEDDTLDKIGRTFNANFQELVSQSESMALSNSSTVFIPVSQRPLIPQPVSHVYSSVAHVIHSPTNSKADSSHTFLLGLYIALVGMMVLRLAFQIRHRFPTLRKASRLEEKLLQWAKSQSVDIEMGVQPENLGGGVRDCSNKSIMYSPQVVREATQNFSRMFHIAGSVYRGNINGRDVVIKRTKGDLSQELKSLKKVEHENLVNLEGFCMTSEGKSYLVYEYVENSSLNLWLHNRPSSVPKIGFAGLTWRTRLQIALDVATGLQYIHEHTGTFHGDLKSSNVLLSRKLRAKITNFVVASSGINAATKHVKGTEGYIAPEYGVDGLASPKIDVFAYGVILLELISGKEAIVKDGREERPLRTQIKVLLEGHGPEENIRKWIDPYVLDTCHIYSATSLALLAKACLEEDVGARPTMVEIVSKLSDLLDVCFEHLEC